MNTALFTVACSDWQHRSNNNHKPEKKKREFLKKEQGAAVTDTDDVQMWPPRDYGDYGGAEIGPLML